MTPRHFTFNELIHTNTDLPNIPNWEQITLLEALVLNVLDPLRELWGRPIHVNSGFRSPAVNKAVGGVNTSHHLCINGCAAADITAGDVIVNKALFDLIIKSGLPFNELIDEKKLTWLHVSFSVNKNRREILHL